MVLIFWNAIIKWSNKLVLPFREVSTNLVGATLSGRFSLSTSVFFCYVILGFLVPLRRKYKDHLIPYIIGSNFSIFGQVEQKISWETFFNVTSKQVLGQRSIGHQQLFSKEEIQSLLPISEDLITDEVLTEDLVSEDLVSEDLASADLVSEDLISKEDLVSEDLISEDLVSEEENLNCFLKRVDLYPDLMVLKLNGRWRSLINQNYTGLLPKEGIETSKESIISLSGRVTSHIDFFRFFTRKRIDFPSFAPSSISSIKTRRKSRLSPPSRSYPLLETGWWRAFHAAGWFFPPSMPWDEIPFKLESDNIWYDALLSRVACPPSLADPTAPAPLLAEGATFREERQRGRPFFFSNVSPLDGKRNAKWDTAWNRVKRDSGDHAVQEIIDELVESDVAPWEEILPDEAIEGRSMSGHRCPDTERKELKALRRYRWSQGLLSLRPFHPPQGGWQDFIQTIQIPLPPTLSLPFPHPFSPSDSSSPPVDIQYRKLELAGLKKFEAKFRESVKDLLDSEQLELIPMQTIFYRGPCVAEGKESTTKDVVSLNEEGSDDIYEWGMDTMGACNPLVNRQQNFFGKKSVLRSEPVTERVVIVGHRYRESMVDRGQEEFSFLLPLHRDQISKEQFFEPFVTKTSSSRVVSSGFVSSLVHCREVKKPFDWEGLEEISYTLAYEAPEDSFFSTAPVDERPMITTIQPNDWNRMVEAQIDGAVDVRTDIAKFDLEFPTIPASQSTGRPFLWPLTQLDYRSVHPALLEQRRFFGEMPASDQERPSIVSHYAPRSRRAIDEPSLYSSMIDPTYKRKQSLFGAKKGIGWVKRVAMGWVAPSPVGPYRELWEPITSLSWLMIYKLLFVMWVEQVGKNFYQSYGKEILLYFITLLASLGFDADTLIDDLGLGEAPAYFRIIPKTGRRFKDLAGIDTTLPTLGEIVWFLRSSGGGKRIPKGFLLVGPPGTGKTFVVQAIAGEAEVPVVIQSATLLIDPEQKESPLDRLKNVFEQARKSAPCILFIDEIDTLGASRMGVMRNTTGTDQLVESVINPSHMELIDQEGSWPGEEGARRRAEERMQEDPWVDQEQDTFPQAPASDQTTGLMDRQKLSLLIQLLVEMDGLQALQGLIVIGATNRPSVLDPALLRPGRFEKVLHLELPGEGKRIEILQLYSRKIGLSQNVSWRYLAQRTAGFSAADLSAVINQSAIQAILQSTTHTMETIEAGIGTIGRQTHQNRWPTERGFLDPFLPPRVAYYQAGKAVVRTTLPPHPAVSYLSLWPDARMESVDRKKELVDQPSFQTLDRLGLEARLIGLYAGKAGELVALSDHLRLCQRRRRQGRQIGSQTVWDSDIGTEEIGLATQVANSMLNNWYLYSREIPLKERNRFLSTRNGDEIKEPSGRKFCKRLSQENDTEGGREGEEGPGYQSHSVSAWWQSQVSKELELVQPVYTNWYRFYLPDPGESDRNDEWLPPDEHYHAPPACQNITTTEKKASLSWNEFVLLDRDYLLHALLTTCFNEAFALVEERREWLDYFADHLIRFHVLRGPTIQLSHLQFSIEKNHGVAPFVAPLLAGERAHSTLSIPFSPSVGALVGLR